MWEEEISEGCGGRVLRAERASAEPSLAAKVGSKCSVTSLRSFGFDLGIFTSPDALNALVEILRGEVEV